MNYSDYRFTLDVQIHQAQVSIPVTLNDTARKLCIGLTDGRKPYAIADGCRAVFVAKKPDKKTIINDCIIERNTIIYEFSQNTTNAEGVVNCEIRLIDADERVITSPQFIIVVDKNVVRDEEVPLSESESTTLSRIISSEEARVAAEKKREEIADFLANSGGVIVSEEEPSESLANVWVKTESSREMFLLDRTDIAQEISDDTDKIPSVGLLKSALIDQTEAIVTEALEQAAQSGDFKGEKGEAGVIEFIIVTELPAEDIKNAIYLVPSADTESGNAFDEYIYVNGAWEKIGNASVAINLEEYVKNTDYATDKKGGVIKTDTRYGTRVVDGILDICAANANVIDGRTPITNPLYSVSVYNRHPIVAGNLDYAVKAALSNSKLEWTGEEKAAAIDLLGGLKKFTVQGNAGDKVYVAKADGTQGTAFIGNSAYQMARYIDESTGGTSPKGYLLTATPLKNYQAANKKYVDDTIATLIERIEELEALVEELSGGNSEFSEGLAYTLSGDEYMLTGRGTCGDSVIIVPSEYNGKPVTSCSYDVFANDAIIEEVYLPSTITDTGTYFCNNCPNLRIMHLLGATSFSSFEFGGLTSLEYVKFGAIQSLDGGIFANCNNTVFDFSALYVVPTLDSYGAGSEFGANPTIKVNAAIYDSWINDTNWANYADYIVAAE